jgi:hypothetical protein
MSLKFTTISQKRLLQGITSTSSTFYLNNILSFDGETDLASGDFGTIHYCAFRNDSGTILELMEIDPVSLVAGGAVTINKRGLSFNGDLTTETTALKLDWPTNTIVMLGTDVPQIFQWLKEYIDGIAIAGAPDATTAIKGLVKMNKAPDDADNPYAVSANDIVSYAADSVGTDSYAITPSPAITAYAAGQMFRFKANTANTGACTLNVNGLGAKTIKKDVSTDLATGDILANQIVTVVYDGTNMQLVSVISGVLTGTAGILPTTKGGTGVNTSVSYSSVIATGIQASGAVNYAHGLGVIPKRIKVTAMYSITNNSTLQPTSQSIGTYDGTNTRMIETHFDNADSHAPGSSTTNIAFVFDANSRTATAAFDATNVILTWSGATASQTTLLIESWAF